jgi:hypothetical protein
MLAILAVATFLLYVLGAAPGVPYHVRELFGNGPTPLKALLFALIVLFALGPPAIFGMQLIRLPTKYVWLFPVGILLHGVLVFLGFRFAAPIESVHSMVGMPAWAIGDELERMIRFVALFLTVSLPIAGGTAMLYAATRSHEPRRWLWWLLFALVLLTAAYFVAVVHAATDNVTLLLRGDANPLSWLTLCLWLLVLSFAASLAAERLSGVFKGTAVALFAVLLFLPVTYAILFVALEAKVGGPASELSALEFLLSDSRERYFFSAGELFVRYALAYAVAVLLLVFAQYPVWLGYATRRFAAPDLVADLAIGSAGGQAGAPVAVSTSAQPQAQASPAQSSEPPRS